MHIAIIKNHSSFRQNNDKDKFSPRQCHLAFFQLERVAENEMDTKNEMNGNYVVNGNAGLGPAVITWRIVVCNH